MRYFSSGIFGLIVAALSVWSLPSAFAEGSATNSRLANATSPYLRLHAPDKVHWYVWGDKPFKLAKERGLPLLVSFGYTACHWCHVMQETHFDNPQLAKTINDNFIPVVVDRERRPDLDEAYMLVTEALTQRGGWPNTVFMTAERKPFYGTGYIPPEDFFRMLTSIIEGWNNQNADVLDEAARLSGLIENFLTRKAAASELSPTLLASITNEIVAKYDEFTGGIGDGNKFFQQSILMFLMHQAERNDNQAALAAVERTLTSIISGGIHDHLEGGVHRYSVDPAWRIPHFEKMLYDQAMMTEAFVEAYRITGDDKYGHMARKIADYVLDDLTSPDGGFYATRDADSQGEEGTYYVWTEEQLVAALGEKEAAFAVETFQIIGDGEMAGKIILNRDNVNDAPNPRVDRILAKLTDIRQHRIKPRRDEKIIMNWNGLMISALAQASVVLGDDAYKSVAIKAGEYIWNKFRTPTGKYNRVVFEGVSAVDAGLADYASVARAFLHLQDATNNPVWLERAQEFYRLMEVSFADPEVGDYFASNTADSNNIGFGRSKPRQDTDLASSNGIALDVVTKLARRTLDPKLKQRVGKFIAALSGIAAGNPTSGASILLAAGRFQGNDTGAVQYTSGGTVRVQASKTPEDQSVILRVNVAKGWHINAQKPLEDYLIATKAKLTFQNKPQGAQIVYPKPTIKTLGFSDAPLALLENEFDIRLSAAKIGHGTSDVELTVQACSDEICLTPELLKFRIAPPIPRRQ